MAGSERPGALEDYPSRIIACAADVSSISTEIEFELPGDAEEAACSGYRVPVECSHIRFREYTLVRDRYLVPGQNLRNELGELAMQKEKLAMAPCRIEGSRPWKAASRYRSIRGKIL